MPYKNPEDRAAWKAAYIAAGRDKPIQERHLALKKYLGIPQDQPIDPVKREAWLARRAAMQAAKHQRTCKMCGASFVSVLFRWYCDEHRPLDRQPTERRECAICSTPFDAPEGSRFTTCSKKCGRENELRRRAALRRTPHWREKERQYKMKRRADIEALRSIGLVPPNLFAKSRDETGWLIPNIGTQAKAIYNFLKEGRTPYEISILTGIDHGSVGRDIWRITKPDDWYANRRRQPRDPEKANAYCRKTESGQTAALIVAREIGLIVD